jgi:chromate transporter
VRDVLASALRLGLTSFGGPIAHLAWFRREYVDRRGWLDEAGYADLVALCQALPGPTSSQLGIAIGTRRAGPAGGLVAWLGFTLPSAVLMVAFGLFAASLDLATAGWIHGLKLAAVAVVAHAVWTMARTLTPDSPRRALAVLALATVLLWSTPLTHLAVIVVGGVIGFLLLRIAPTAAPAAGLPAVPRRLAPLALGVFVVLLVGLPFGATLLGQPVALWDALYRAGAVVFGGGHVVLPLLHESVVAPGWLTTDQFLAGYGAAQALPGPLFAFGGYVGTVAAVPTGGVVGGTLALFAIFLPSVLLVFGALPFWEGLRTSRGFRRALAGTNAAVVGVLGAALYDPVWTGAVGGPSDVVIAAAGLAVLATSRVSPIVVVVASALIGQIWLSPR